MGVTPFIMVLIGCSQGSGPCETIATMPVAYVSEASCLGSRSEILSLTSDLGYARVTADCRPQASAVSRNSDVRRAIPTT